MGLLMNHNERAICQGPSNQPSLVNGWQCNKRTVRSIRLDHSLGYVCQTQHKQTQSQSGKRNPLWSHNVPVNARVNYEHSKVNH